MATLLEKLVEDLKNVAGDKPGEATLSSALTAIAKRGAEHEQEMERIKGEMQRGARAGKGRFRI